MARRCLQFAAALTVALVAAPAAHALGPRAAAAKVRDCDTDARTATFTASMRALRGTQRLQLRFALQGRSPGAPAWATLDAPGFGTWLSAKPGRTGFVYDKTVKDLPAPGRYRIVVRFRWRDAAGRIARHAKRISAGCRQPDPRPDLVPLRVRSSGGPSATTRRYTVTVLNAGRARADATSVGLTVAQTVLAPAPLPSLAGGEEGRVRFVGPRCGRGSALSATVDPGGLVAEADEAGNVLAVACPPR